MCGFSQTQESVQKRQFYLRAACSSQVLQATVLASAHLPPSVHSKSQSRHLNLHMLSLFQPKPQRKLVDSSSRKAILAIFVWIRVSDELDLHCDSLHLPFNIPQSVPPRSVSLPLLYLPCGLDSSSAELHLLHNPHCSLQIGREGG